MTLEEIKKFYKEDVLPVFQEGEYSTRFGWLIAEVERLKSEEHVNLRTVMAFEAGQRGAAERCVEIVEKSVPTMAANVIRTEFKL